MNPNDFDSDHMNLDRALQMAERAEQDRADLESALDQIEDWEDSA